MSTITTKDGTEIFYKDWGTGQPIVFSHGWPLSADDWDAQMLFFLGKGFRVIAHDRRGHGRSTQTGGGHDMDHYADDLAAVTAHLDLKNAIHVGHSTGGGEVVHYLARHGESRVAKAAIITRGAAADGEDGGQSGRAAQGGIRRTCRRSSPPTAPSSTTICRPGRSMASTGRRESLAGGDLELVASGHDGRRQGALRRHRRLLSDRLHRRPEENHRAGAGDARR